MHKTNGGNKPPMSWVFLLAKHDKRVLNKVNTTVSEKPCRRICELRWRLFRSFGRSFRSLWWKFTDILGFASPSAEIISVPIISPAFVLKVNIIICIDKQSKGSFSFEDLPRLSLILTFSTNFFFPRFILIRLVEKCLLLFQITFGSSGRAWLAALLNSWNMTVYSGISLGGEC